MVKQLGLMEYHTKEIILMIRNMVMEYRLVIMGNNMMENGMKICRYK